MGAIVVVVVVGSRSLQNFYSCRYDAEAVADAVPVLYKISTLVDIAKRCRSALVPVLYKISTLVDRVFPLFYFLVPVLYKISTLVDARTFFFTA